MLSGECRCVTVARMPRDRLPEPPWFLPKPTEPHWKCSTRDQHAAKLDRARTASESHMGSNSKPSKSPPPATSGLARPIADFAQSDGDYATAIPALSLHRRQVPTEPLHCIFNLGLGVVAQGDKQAMVGEEVISYGPGQSMLTTIDLPVISHVTRATVQEPLLGLMLTWTAQRSVQSGSGDATATLSTEDPAYRPISIEVLDDALLERLGPLGQPSR